MPCKHYQSYSGLCLSTLRECHLQGVLAMNLAIDPTAAAFGIKAFILGADSQGANNPLVHLQLL